MREAARKGLFTVVAAGGVLAAGAGYAQADTAADGSATGSGGVVSGNALQVPVHAPVNACGNTVTAIGLLNPATSNLCGNGEQEAPGTSAVGDASESGGVVSGNDVQVPVHVPVNACGNTATVVGLLSAVDGNVCGPGAAPEAPQAPQAPETPGTAVPGAEVPQVPQVPAPQLPQTPATPAVPQVPPAPQVPDTPASPSAPQTPSSPSAPQTPSSPSSPSSPSTPDTPGAPDAPATPSGRVVRAHEGGAALAETGPAGLEVVAPLGAGLLLGGLVLYRRSRPAGR